jgi:hypothetical protein
MSERITIHYIYLLIEREFIKSGESIYKIGRSKRSHKKTTLLTQRICEYPKGSKCILCRIVNNCYWAEATIKKVFGQKFINRPDIGTEYFEGDIELMKLEFIKIAEEYSVVEGGTHTDDADDYSVFMFGNKINNVVVDSIDDDDYSGFMFEKKNNKKLPTQINCFCCEKCNASFKTNYDLTRHFNKKIPCGKEEKERHDIANKTCLYCDVIYANTKCVKRHMRICPFRPTESDELKQIIVQLNNKINNQDNKINNQNNKISNMTRQMEEINAIQKYTL